MRSYQDEIIADYSCKQLFDLIIDVEKYSEFIPWCAASRILNKQDNYFDAQLVINFKNITECYTSKVNYIPYNKISVRQLEGPFSYLLNEWQFEKISNNQTKIKFSIEFAFQSIILDKVIGIIYQKAISKMTDSFLDRAHKLYR